MQKEGKKHGAHGEKSNHVSISVLDKNVLTISQ
jgi:hypothetical protein